MKHRSLKLDRRRVPRHFAVIVIAVLAVLAAVPAAADLGGYVIRDFDTRLTVESNSDVHVEERIEVEFLEPRHGIYRTIPVRYADPRGFAYSLRLRLSGVTDERGRAQQTQISSQGRYTKIRIGSPERMIAGRVVYVIRYRVSDALGRFPEHDELYWNATGNEWNTTIDHASATIRLPAPLSAGEMNAAGYTGAMGSRGRAVTITSPEPGVVHFESTTGFDPLEGMTIAVGWPQGHVRFPSAVERALRFVIDNVILLLPFVWLMFLIQRYRQRGRDPEASAPVMVQYEPPPGVSAGEVGTLIDERADVADITATIVDLAVRRHLTIRIEERPQLFGLFTRSETVFTREDPSAGDALLPHENRVMSALFAHGEKVDAADLANKFYSHIPGICEALYDRLVEKGYFDSSPQKVRTKYVTLGFLAGIVTGLVSAGWLTLRGIGAPPLVLLPIFTGAVTLLLFIGFSPAMPRRTASGVRTRQWAQGFQEFTRRVEADRLERSASDPRATFESLLPYAMALGVAGDWARRFEGIYRDREPGWFVGSRPGGGFSTRTFERSLSTAMTRASQTMTASPRSSSGSGGGGSSGGGGGGGGGGSW